jgi:hypothetical protein
LHSTCRFKGIAAGIKEEEKRDGGRKQSFAVVIPIMRDERFNAYFV